MARLEIGSGPIEGAKERLQNYIQQGTAKMGGAVRKIIGEYDARVDMLAAPRNFTLEAQEESGDIDVNLTMPDQRIYNLRTTAHSKAQVLDRAGIPQGFHQKLIELGMTGLANQNLNLLTEKQNDKLLIRRVGDEIKGWLSPSYRRMDARPVFDSFIEEADRIGLKPFDGDVSASRYQLKMIYPELFEPAPGEFIALGASITTSDYGAKALSIELSVLRIWCRNLAIGFDAFRQIHLGKRFDAEVNGHAVILSSQTNELDTKTIASATRDVVKSLPAYFPAVQGMIMEANKSGLEIKDAIADLRKRGAVSKKMSEQVEAIYGSQVSVEVLPQGNSKWRLSNVLSLMAQADGMTTDQKLDLQSEAWRVAMGSQELRKAA